MRFLISVIDTATGTGTPEETAAIDEFNARLVADGHWVFACGLAAPSTAVQIDARGTQAVVTEEPLHATNEYVSGFWIITAADHAEALWVATEGSRCCNRRVELRALLGN